MKTAVRLGLLALSSFASFQVIWAQSYTFTAISGIGRPSGLNEAGQIVGYSLGGEQTRGFLYTNGSAVSITAPGSTNTFVYGINNAGQIVGAANASGAGTYGFVYVSNKFTTISVPGSRSTVARGINDSGQIVGTVIDSQGRQNGFIYTAGTFTTLTVPGSSTTYAYGINNSSQIVGTFTQNDGRQSGFLYDKGNFTRVDVPDSADTVAYAVNNLGQIVGSFVDDSGTHGFIYIDGVFTTIDDPGVPSSIGTLPVGLNDGGEIVGFSSVAFVAVPVGTSSLVLYPQSRIYSSTGGSPPTSLFAVSGGVPGYSWSPTNLPDGLGLITSGRVAALTGSSDLRSSISVLKGMRLMLPNTFEIETADQSGHSQANIYLAAFSSEAFPQFFGNGAEQTLFNTAETRVLIGLQVAAGIQSCGTSTVCGTLAEETLSPVLLSLVEASLGGFANSVGLPDPDFQNVAIPQVSSREPIGPAGELGAALAASLNDLALNERQQGALSFALLASLDRASGASIANEEYWRSQQLDVAKWFALQLKSLQEQEPALLAAVADALSGTALDLALDPQTVVDSRLQVALSGLRSGTKALLLNAGVTEDELPFVERAIAAANYTPVAHRLSEAFRSQSLNTAASVAAFALGTFGGDRNGDGVVGCSDLALVNAAINTRIGDPGFNVLADVNVDGVVDDRDLALVLMQLPAVLSCK